LSWIFSDNLVLFALSPDIFEGAAQRDFCGAKIHHLIELTVKQAFPRSIALSLKISAPKLRILKSRIA
jgi:hypothetical protein